MLVGGDYKPPRTVVPDAWYANVHNDLRSGHSSLERWWERFHDPSLNRLIARARSYNPDLRKAAEHIEEARAARHAATSSLFPTVNASADGTHGHVTKEVPNSLAGKTGNILESGFDAAWELDLFGSVRRSVESANASAEAVEEDYRDTMVSLLAEVAVNYIQYRTYDERIRLAESNIRNQRDSVNLTTGRFNAGLVPELDVSQATSNLATSEALVPLLRNQRTQAANRLAILVGGYPEEINVKLSNGKPIPVADGASRIGLPADLVRSRPDIRRAERLLAAQTARIGVAQADLFPHFTLSGDLKLEAGSFNNLGNGLNNLGSGDAYSFGPSIRWKIFTAGRVRDIIRIEKSRTRQAYLSYESTVLKAVGEVENALASVANEHDRLGSLEKAVTAAEKSVSLVKGSYSMGLVDFQRVLDVERTIFAGQDEAATSRGQIAADYVALFKALGGGTPMTINSATPISRPRDRTPGPSQSAAPKPNNTSGQKPSGAN